MKLTELIAAAPWREAVTYRETWPHEYVLLHSRIVQVGGLTTKTVIAYMLNYCL